MCDKKLMEFKISLMFPEGDVTCKSCIFCAKSCVTATHCSVMGSVIPANEKGRILDCPLKPI